MVEQQQRDLVAIIADAKNLLVLKELKLIEKKQYDKEMKVLRKEVGTRRA